MRSANTQGPRPWGRLVVIGALLLGGAVVANAARITGVSPQGEVAQLRQVVVRFDQAVSPLGQPDATAPMSLACSGPLPPQGARWSNEREWVINFQRPLPPGVRCTLAAAPGWNPLQGTLEGNTRFEFGSGGPAIERSQPWEGSTVEEDQQFLLRLTGPATAESVQASSWCEVDGIGERIPVRLVGGDARATVLKALRVKPAEAERQLLLGCSRPLPPQAKLRLVWGAGIAAAANPAVQTRAPQRLRFEVRPRFGAEFSCEREKAQAPCMPLGAAVLRFSAPVPRVQLEAARLTPAGGQALTPKFSSESAEVEEIRFTAPLPENTRFKLSLPAGLKDASGRPLANAASFPLEFATGPMPPIAKFAAAPFGILEAGPDTMLPITLRHVQPDLRGAAVRIKKIDEREWLAWMGRLAKAQDNEFESRQQPLLARDGALLRLDLPPLQGGDPRPFEVVGIPLAEPGYHVVEIESRLLGERLLAQPKPMYVRTGVLVTNLGVHFKRGQDGALVWVTTLDRAQPVAGAEVTVHDCRGQVLWQGRSDAQGLATVPHALPPLPEDKPCSWQHGYYVTASRVAPDAQGRPRRDTAFVYSHWHRGIEPWRFNLPLASADERSPAEHLRVHTVFDRTLLRAGETVSMKHLLRLATRNGLSNAPRDQWPSTLKITHAGSGDEHKQPLQFDAAGRAALSSWAIPPTAKLGLYDVSLKNGEREWPAGRFRVEEFRLPLVDAQLAPPRGDLVAPAEVLLGLQLKHLSGGGVARAPLRASALLRDRLPSFPGYETFSFQPPSDPARRETGDEDSPADGARVVIDKQAFTTDAQGAASIALKGLPSIKQPGELQAELSFNDPNGEVQTVSTRLPLWPAARVVGLRSGPWAAAAGKLKFQALVLDLRGRPLADAKAAVQARVTQWQATRKRLAGGFYAYDQQATHKDLGPVCEGKTDARGLLLCEAAIAAHGEVELVARSADEAGRTAEAATTVWVTRQGELWFEQDNDDRIDVLADKPHYEPGETARLQVRMPYRQATALVSIEREGVIHSKVVTLQGSDPVVELLIPKGRPPAAGAEQVADSWAPNVFASVLVVRGRLREVPWYSFFSWGWRSPGEWWRAFRFEGREYQAPTAMVDLAKPSHKFGVAALRVGLAAHQLDVKVSTDQPQYAVRQTVKARVQVSQGGQPAAGAEIAFAAVDEALLALMDNRSWQLLEAMFPPRGWAVETASAQGEIIGRRHYGRKAVPAGGGGGRNPTRELFDTLLLWRGSITLDANGQATVEVPLNDSLTSFRLVALASAGTDRFGTGHTVVRVTQDLQMLPGLPPLAREGDRFDAIFTLRNTTAREMKVEATLAASVQQDDGAGGLARSALNLPPQTITLAAGAAAEARWPVEVPPGAISLVYEAAATQAGGNARDRVKFTQLVKPLVPLRVWAASLQPLDGAATLPVAPPADAISRQGVRAGGVQLGLQPSLATALPGIRRYFETYPFTCLEQQASRALALRDAAGWSKLAAALSSYLDADGLALYYPPREGDPPRGSDRLTAHLVAAAHEAGQALPEAARERMLAALTAFVEGRLSRDSWSGPAGKSLDLEVRKLAAIEALTRHGRAVPRLLDSITVAPNRWPTAALIDWLRILQRLDGVPERAAKLQEAQAVLRARLSYNGTTLKFSTEDSDNWWWLMDNADGNAARLILALADEPAWKDELPRLVLGALARQQRGAWSTTTANLWGVLALERFAARFETGKVAGRSSATLAGASVAHDWAAAPTGGRLLLPWPATAGSSSAPATLSLQHQGSGKPWAAVQALAAVPLQAPVAAGYRITRSISSVERKTEGAWSRGDVQRVRLEIEAQADMSWVALNDPVPAGATLLGGGLNRDSSIATQGEKREGRAWLAYEERAQDAYRASWEFMPRGKHVIEYTLRLNSAGRFGLPPTRVEAMYAPENFGELPLAVLEVRP